MKAVNVKLYQIMDFQSNFFTKFKKFLPFYEEICELFFVIIQYKNIEATFGPLFKNLKDAKILEN